MVDETLSLHGRSDETRWGNLHTFQGAGALFVLAGGCERAGDQMKQDGATIHAFTSSMLRQTNFSCVSTYICKPSILLAFVTHAFHIQQAETNKVPLPTSRHTYASHPSRLALVAPSFTSSRPRQTNFSCVSTYICKPPIPPRLGRPMRSHPAC